MLSPQCVPELSSPIRVKAEQLSVPKELKLNQSGLVAPESQHSLTDRSALAHTVSSVVSDETVLRPARPFFGMYEVILK